MNNAKPDTLPRHIRALLRPDAYAHPAASIQLIQTHASYVVVAGDHAYKLKKALDLGFADWRTLEQRRQNCLEEIRLNARGCPSLYYGVLSVNRFEGAYRLDGPGEAVDYAVHMRRIAEERTLASLIESPRAGFDMIGRVAWKLLRFHAAAEDGPRVRAIGGLATMAENWRSNLDAMAASPAAGVTGAALEGIRGYGDAFIEANQPLFLRREEEGRVRECHGDLRADAICFDEEAPDGVCLFDCLEFSERLRYSDTGLDVAFLAMDLERRGRRDLSDLFQSLYTAAAGDKTLPLVSRFFRCYRALVRAKVAAILAADTGVTESQRRAARADAAAHVRLAWSYARPNAPPQIVMVMGLTGSGKSVAAGALAHRIGAAYLSTDVIRKEQAGLPAGARAAAAPGRGLYSQRRTRMVYAEMLRQAGESLDSGYAVVLDGTYLTRDLRAPVARLARRRGVQLRVVECRAGDDVVRKRQEDRRGQPWTTSDATWAIYVSQKQSYQPPAEVAEEARASIEAGADLTAELDRIEAMLAQATVVPRL